MFYCYSEKEDVSIAFGTSFESNEELIDSLDTNWIYEGMSESFWENAFEFDSGIEKAIKINDDNPNLTYKQALYAVFGDFAISYTIDGKETDINFEIDINQAMYDLLMEL